MHALARLIQSCREADPSLSYARIAALSDGAFTHAMAHRWGSGKRLDRMPEPQAILGLAHALRRPPLEVLHAAADAAGIDITDPALSEFARRLPPDVDHLPNDVREDILRLLWTLRDKTIHPDTTENG